MSIVDHFSSSHDRRDQEMNRALARRIADEDNKIYVEEICQVLASGPTKKIEDDAILTLAALSELKPEMLYAKFDFLLPYLKSSNNRAVFGTMIVMAHISPFIPSKMFSNLSEILDAMDEGTVVTRDHGFKIMVKLYEIDQYREDLLPLICEQVLNAPDNQAGQYAERIADTVRSSDVKVLLPVLQQRLAHLENSSHIGRMQKICRKLLLSQPM